MTKEEVLQNCTVEGMVVKLPPGQLDRNLYIEVAKALNLINGKWKGGKVMGFVFQEDPTELLEQISNGEKKNLKKEYQFFATPDDLADKLVEMASLEECHYTLEPSAGQGSIVKAIGRKFPNMSVDCFELMEVNQTILRKIKNVFFCEDDFLATKNGGYNRIIANPPFSKNQDIDHIRKMYSCLEVGGRLVSISSKHWQLSNNKKETAFREWLKEINAKIEEIPAGSFKSSGTAVGGLIITIDKI